MEAPFLLGLLPRPQTKRFMGIIRGSFTNIRILFFLSLNRTLARVPVKGGLPMTKAIETAVKLLESLPETTQESLVEELRRLALEAQDEAKWDAILTQGNGLKAAAQQARVDIAAGQSCDMDYEKL